MNKIKSLLVLLACMAATSLMAQTAAPAKKFTLEVSVRTNSSTRFFAAGSAGDPIHFNATLQIAGGINSLPCYDESNWPPSGVHIIIDCAYIPPKADFYFGVIGPDGTTYSLVAGDNANPIQGLVPIATDMDLSKARTLDLNKDVGSISYAFKRDNAQGLYTVFALLVMAGNNPAEPQSWLEAEMKPLMADPTLSFGGIANDTSGCNLCNDVVYVP
jgi:hypothetical protein